jgi:hypothetical protein
VRKVLEAACVEPPPSLPNDLSGPAARLTLEALMAGGRDLDQHDAFMLSMHVAHVDHLTAAIERLDDEMQSLTRPFAEPSRTLARLGRARRSSRTPPTTRDA